MLSSSFYKRLQKKLKERKRQKKIIFSLLSKNRNFFVLLSITWIVSYYGRFHMMMQYVFQDFFLEIVWTHSHCNFLISLLEAMEMIMNMMISICLHDCRFYDELHQIHLMDFCAIIVKFRMIGFASSIHKAKVKK